MVVALLGGLALVTDGPATMVIESGLVAVAPTLSVAVTENVKLPVAVGVPERTPALLSVKPAGKVPVLVNVRGAVPPVAATVWL